MLTHQEQRFNNLKRILLCALGSGVFLFIAANLYPILHGPSIDVEDIRNGTTYTEPVIHLSGKARFTKDLMVNGVMLKTSPDGTFSENLVLMPGYNLISMSGRDRFGTSTEKNYAFVLNEEESGTVTIRPTLVPRN